MPTGSLRIRSGGQSRRPEDHARQDRSARNALENFETVRLDLHRGTARGWEGGAECRYPPVQRLSTARRGSRLGSGSHRVEPGLIPRGDSLITLNEGRVAFGSYMGQGRDRSVSLPRSRSAALHAPVDEEADDDQADDN